MQAFSGLAAIFAFFKRLNQILLLALTISCFLILGIQITYITVFLIAFGKKTTISEANHHPVSVIVCAHDEEQNLRELVPALLAQDHPEFEVIIVEDRCNDETYDYLLQATKEDARLKMVRVVNKPEHINGKKYGLTLGIKAARHEWVLFTDADCRPASPNWIKTMTKEGNAESKIVLGFSPYFKMPGLLNAFIRFEAIVTGIQFIGLALLGKPYMGVGRNLSYSKSLFLNNKGFNDYLGLTGGDDDLFVNQHATFQNTTVVTAADALVYSFPKTTWKDYYYQKLRHLTIGKYYKLSDKAILAGFSVTWLLTYLWVIPAAAFSPLFYWIGGVFLVRWILLTLLTYNASKRLGDPFETWKTPFLDFIYTFYYLVAGAMALFVKKVRWKN